MRDARRWIVAMALTLAGILAAGPAFAAEKAQSAGPLRDLRSAQDVTDGAVAHVTAETTGNGGTWVQLKVQNLDHAAVGETFGAHVHAGQCEEGNGAAALGHYRAPDFVAPATPQNEVWLDFTVEPGGVARSEATVPFVIEPGDRSVVIHEHHTAPGGAAGARLACLPVQF